MKKIITLALILLSVITISAQYKKASFFSKTGRTYGLGIDYRFMPKDAGKPKNIFFSTGAEITGRRLFHEMHLGYMLPFNFSYNTTDTYDDRPITVKGKTKGAFTYDLDFAFHLLSNEEKKKVQPFLFAGFGLVVHFSDDVKLDYPSGTNPKAYPESSAATLIRGGGGFILNFSESFSLKLDGGYSLPLNLYTAKDDEDYIYKIQKNQVFVRTGIRYTLNVE